ncbi:hypothetical protein EGR_06844 [Echinococcus granulosus]|uniref:Uncharacterized protein n=1 Tax=Echinococcus granulosus TaxID=6210 RepID=W6UJL8_ECHGR|nr:hypothetical protein EGR_06844 [Echinococcus granulosus]EUB58317.1 hypothetical protein EGR_06844 [Echinococcus granulosus]
MRVVLCDKRLITALMARTAVNNCLIPYSSMPTKASGDLISEIATQTRHEDARLMRKYKRRLLMILGSIDSDGHLSQVRITNLATSSDGRILTVFWTMAEGSHSDITAWKVDNLLRNANKSIRQRLARENAFRKVPILNFIHSPSDLLSDPTEDQVDVNSCHIVKPNNVYGLPWDEYMKEVRRNRQDDAVMVDSENMDADCHRERGSCPSQAANWARRWQKQHNAKLVAKRERKRSHQMLESDTTTFTTTSTLNTSNAEIGTKPELSSHKKREYPPPPPERIGRFRYSLFVIGTYVGLGNCIFFCCLPLLGFENIFRAMGYPQPISLLCAACHMPVATFCMCSCVLCKVRRQFRKKRGINGSFILDCLLSCLLCCCVATQLLTEARAVIIDRKNGVSKPDGAGQSK